MEKRLEKLEKEIESLKRELNYIEIRQKDYVPLLVNIPKDLMRDINMAANQNKYSVEDYVTSILLKYARTVILYDD